MWNSIWCWRVWDHHTNSCFLTSLLLPYFLSFSLFIGNSFFSAHSILLVVDIFLFNHPSTPSLLLTILDLIYPTGAHPSSLLFWTRASLSLWSFTFYTNFLPSLSLDLFPHVYPVWSSSVTPVYVALCVCVWVSMCPTRWSRLPFTRPLGQSILEAAAQSIRLQPAPFSHSAPYAAAARSTW